jgi:hypothetical protein
MWGLSILAGFVMARSAEVFAQERETSQLSYVVRTTGTACPDEKSFRNLVAGRLGYDPFESTGKHETSVELTREGVRLRGRAQVKRQGSAAAGVRELVVGAEECDALAAALATAVAIALDPFHAPQASAPSGSEPLPEPPPAPRTIVVLERPAPPQRPPQASKPTPISFFSRAAAAVSVGAAPGPVFGGELGLGLGAGLFSAEATGRLETTAGATRVDSGDRLEATIISGALTPCIRHPVGLFGCVQGRVGAFQGRAPDVVEPSLGSSLFGAVALSGGYILELSRVFALTANLEAGAPLVRTSLSINDKPVWTAPPMFGGGAVGLIVTPL